MNKYLILLFLALICSCKQINTDGYYETKTVTEGEYTHEYVAGDPMKTRIYTLENGLKVYLSDYDNAPRCHVYIPVKAGGKNDPAENTGLAHYLEHMMFKGNHHFGTENYAEEKVLLDSIENLFNQYAQLTDSTERVEFYKKIDAVSNKAAEYAIPNEYDNMISLLGGKGLNAYTTEDRTVYTIDIPANELSRFLEIEGSRFKKIVNRLFHTELETVYEEKNRSLDNDYWKVAEKLAAGMFTKHPYGTQTVIGTIEHLKNPSITAIKNYFNTYYRPNNAAICISGDIDYAKTIALIDKYFGDWEPNEALPTWTKIEEDPITTPKEFNVVGPDSESIELGFRCAGYGSADHMKAQLLDMVLNNAEAGLIDINLLQNQEVLGAGCYVNAMNDYSVHTFYGEPKQGQSLEEVRDLILEQIEKVKNGEFEDWLIKAVITDFKKSQMYKLENNSARANSMVMAFTNNIPWSEHIQEIEKMEKITKEELVTFANQVYQDNYVIVYKKNGEDPNKKKVDKPIITKVPLNREAKSQFHEKIEATSVDKLSPVFVDMQKDINQLEVAGVKVLAKENTENKTFDLTYLLDFGKNADPKIKMAISYLEFLGTKELSAEDLKKELYKLGCSYSVFASTEKTYVTLSGLDENMEAAAQLFESLLADPQPDQNALDNLVDRTFKSRVDAKKNKGAILWSGLYNYAKYGAKNPFNDVISNNSLNKLKAEELTQIIQDFTKYPHRVLYYGPRKETEIKEFLSAYHKVPSQFKEMPQIKTYEELAMEEPKVFWSNYDMVQSEIILLSKDIQYDAEVSPSIRLYNEYFGSLVFQEIREAQGLAYSVFSNYQEPYKKDKSNYMVAYVGIQADKQPEALAAMNDLLENLPESEQSFQIAKNAILNKIESERVTKSDILWSYINAEDRGLDYDLREKVYEKVKNMSFEDLKEFHAEYVKGKKYSTVLVGSKDKINFDNLKKFGAIQEVSLDELFGYEDPEPIVMK